MTKLGYDSYLKFAKEVVFGDGTTPSVCVPVKSISAKPEVMLKSRASELRSSRFPQKPLAGAQWTPMNFLMNGYPDEAIGYFLFLHHDAPSVVAVDTGVYDNTFEPGLSMDNSFSMEYSPGGANPVLVPGFMSRELQFSQGISDEAQMLTLQVSGGGKFGTEGSPTTFTDITAVPFQFDECVLSYDGGNIYVDNLQWTDNNGLLIPNHKISGGAETRQPVISTPHALTGQFVVDHDDMSYFDDYRNLSDIALIATWTSLTAITGSYYYTLTVTMPCIRVSGSPIPDATNPNKIQATIPFTAYAGTVGSSSVPVSYKLRSGTDFSSI